MKALSFQTIDVTRLIRGKPQDNLEFLQFMKKYWDDHFSQSSQYDALERRMSAKGVPQKAVPPKRMTHTGAKDEKENVSPAIAKAQAPSKRLGPGHTPISAAPRTLANATSTILNSKQKQQSSSAAAVAKKSKQTGKRLHLWDETTS